MNAVRIQLRLAFALALLAGAAATDVHAQVEADSPATVPEDSLTAVVESAAAPLPGPPDSLVVSASPDSLVASGLPDSLGATGQPDSLASAAADTTAAAKGPEPAPWLPPWQPGPANVDRPLIDWTRPVDYEGAFAWLDGTSVRVAGETGMDAFVDTGPLDVAPELIIDGLPSRNPADLDPAIWDRASTMVTSLSTTRGSPAYSWGQTAIRGSFAEPLVGRTVVQGRFTRTAHETYTREIGLRAPGSQSMLRYDFREFKTEESYDYSLAPAVVGDLDRGHSKQRQFRFGGQTRTRAGEVGFEFGRGRRHAVGNAVDTRTRERWTGRLALTFDRASGGAAWHGRLYHLDFRDDWFSADTGSSAESRDGARLGLRLERVPSDGGFYGGAVIEHQSARFLPPALAAAATTYVQAWTADLGWGWRAPADADWRPWAAVRIVGAEHTREAFDLGGRAGLGRSLGEANVQVIVERIPRTPTLVESYGVYSRHVVTPTASDWTYDPIRLVYRPGGEMDFERQDRAGVRVDGRSAHWRWSAEYSVWRLSRGIGLEPGTIGSGVGEAFVVSGVETDLDMIEVGLGYDRSFGRWRLRALGRGHQLPGHLDPVAARPGGWPRLALRGRVGVDREFFSSRNRLGLDVEADFMGEHFDDVTGLLGGVVSRSTVLNSRVWLGIRDAEVFLAVDNLLDAERMETLGTWRRFRQFTLGLNWDFFN